MRAVKGTWLLPSVKTGLPAANARMVGKPDGIALARMRYRKWMQTKGRAYFANRMRDPEYKAKQFERQKAWLKSRKGVAWAAANRERRNHYHLMRYHADPKRQEYLRLKQREYRAAKKAKAIE